MYGSSTQNKGRICFTEQYQPVFNTMGLKVEKSDSIEPYLQNPISEN